MLPSSIFLDLDFRSWQEPPKNWINKGNHLSISMKKVRKTFNRIATSRTASCATLSRIPNWLNSMFSLFKTRNLIKKNIYNNTELILSFFFTLIQIESSNQCYLSAFQNIAHPSMLSPVRRCHCKAYICSPSIETQLLLRFRRKGKWTTQTMFYIWCHSFLKHSKYNWTRKYSNLVGASISSFLHHSK